MKDDIVEVSVHDHLYHDACGNSNMIHVRNFQACEREIAIMFPWPFASPCLYISRSPAMGASCSQKLGCQQTKCPDPRKNELQWSASVASCLIDQPSSDPMLRFIHYFRNVFVTRFEIVVWSTNQNELEEIPNASKSSSSVKQYQL